jgi:hypothetical protein
MLEILALSLFAVRYEIARHAYTALRLTKYGTVMSVVRFISLCVMVPLSYYIGGTQGVIWGVALHPLAAVPVVYAFNAKLGYSIGVAKRWSCWSCRSVFWRVRR